MAERNEPVVGNTSPERAVYGAINHPKLQHALELCSIVCEGVGKEKTLNIMETFRCLEPRRRFLDDFKTLINDTFDQLVRDNAPNEFQCPFRIKGCDKPAGNLTRFYLSLTRFYLSIFPEKRWGYLVDMAKRALMDLSWLDFSGCMNYMSFATWLEHVLELRDTKRSLIHSLDQAQLDGRTPNSVGSEGQADLRLNFALVERPMARKFRFPPEVAEMFFGFISNYLPPSNLLQDGSFSLNCDKSEELLSSLGTHSPPRFQP